jgi:hypothetical protein
MTALPLDTVPPLDAGPSLPGTLLAEEDPSTLSMPSSDGPLGDPERYRFRGVLGIGGMGQVDLRSDERIGREVAFKTSTGAGPQNRARFVREGLLQARLEHPAFVPVYDIGIDQAGAYFFTMRRIKGRTLADIVLSDHGAFTQRRLLGAFVQLCLAVDFAHVRGVVHRDLKPANVMLGDFGEIYVLDWGIAKVTGESEDLPAMGEAKIVTGDVPAELVRGATLEGTVLGTLGYMAPEQLRGQHAALDGRADVYALGAILFEVLTREPVHRGNLAEIVVSTLERPAASPRERAPSCDVAPELDAIVRRALETDRDERFPSARALAGAVERYLEGDRDQTLRRAQADELSASAMRTLARSGDHQARADAGRAAVRALALAPDHAVARRVLVDVVTGVPTTEPIEATESAAAAQKTGGIALTRWYARMLGGVCALFAAVLFASGVRDVPLVLAMLATGFGAAAVIGLGALARGGSGRWITAGFALLCVANMLFTRWIGPFIAVPLTMFINTVAMTFYATRGERALRLAMSIAAVTLPVIADVSGLVPPAFTIEPDRMIVYARAVSFPGWLPWALSAMTAAMIACTLVMTHFLDQIASLQKRVHVQAWMLRQVVGTNDE